MLLGQQKFIHFEASQKSLSLAITPHEECQFQKPKGGVNEYSSSDMIFDAAFANLIVAVKSLVKLFHSKVGCSLHILYVKYRLRLRLNSLLFQLTLQKY